MKLLAALCALTLAAPAVAQAQTRGQPLVVISTGRLVVFNNDRPEVAARLDQADRYIAEARAQVRKNKVEKLLDNARNRIDNAREFLGLTGGSDRPVITPNETRRDERLADAAYAYGIVVVDYESLLHEIDRAENNVERALQESNRVARVMHSLNAARAELQGARNVVMNSIVRYAQPQPMPTPQLPPGPPPPVNPPPPMPPPQPQVWPMPQDAFNGLLGAMDREPWSNGRLNVLGSAAQGHYFTVSQVSALLQRFPFAQHKLQAVRLVAGRIVDPQNNFQLFGSFDFNSDKEELKRILAGAQFSPQPINPAELQGIMAAMEGARWGGAQAQLRIISEQSGGRWFLADQAAALAGRFQSWGDRMRVLEILRPRILDPQNSRVLEGLFVTTSDQEKVRQMFSQY